MVKVYVNDTKARNIRIAIVDVMNKDKHVEFPLCDLQKVIMQLQEIQGLFNKSAEKTIRKRDEIEQQLKNVEFCLKCKVEQKFKKEWKGYRDALKWVLLYPPEYEKPNKGGG